MNLDRLISAPVLALITVAGLTTFFGRKSTAGVVDSLGRAFGGAISAALGNGGKVA